MPGPVQAPGTERGKAQASQWEGAPKVTTSSTVKGHTIRNYPGRETSGGTDLGKQDVRSPTQGDSRATSEKNGQESATGDWAEAAFWAEEEAVRRQGAGRAGEFGERRGGW